MGSSVIIDRFILRIVVKIFTIPIEYLLIKILTVYIVPERETHAKLLPHSEEFFNYTTSLFY